MKISRSMASVALGLWLIAAAHAQDGVGSVTRLEGAAAIVDQVRTDTVTNLLLGGAVFEGDRVRTRSGTRLLEITFGAGGRLRMDANSQVEISQYGTGTQNQGILSRVRGRIRAVVTEVFSDRPDSYQMRTQTAIVGVQGTVFSVQASDLSTRVEVEEGIVSVRNIDPAIVGTTRVGPGQFVIVNQGQPPGISQTVTQIPGAPAQTGTGDQTSDAEDAAGSGSTLAIEADGSQSGDPSNLTPDVPSPVTVPRIPTLPAD